MLTKYDWSNVANRIKFISTDSEGWKFYHTSEPDIVGDGGWFSLENNYDGYIECFESDQNEYKGNWRNSLERRPVVK